MAKVNTAGSGHGRFTSAAGNHYFEYTDPKVKKILDQALFILKHNVKGMKPCNKCFKALPGGRSFDDILDDPNVWINYDSRTNAAYGATHGVGGSDITIMQSSFNKGRWWVAGVIVHELAHVNGAPLTTAEADETLLCCGLKNAYEGVIGVRPSSPPDSGYA